MPASGKRGNAPEGPDCPPKARIAPPKGGLFGPPAALRLACGKHTAARTAPGMRAKQLRSNGSKPGTLGITLCDAERTSQSWLPTSVDDPGCSLTRGWMSSFPRCTCRVHCSLRSRGCALCMMALEDVAGYRRLEAANGSDNGLSQAAMACARVAATSGPNSGSLTEKELSDFSRL